MRQSDDSKYAMYKTTICATENRFIIYFVTILLAEAPY